MSQWPLPSDREQLQFLKNIQRLLAEGSFVASYKFALLHALADLALLKGDDTGAPLELTTHQIATQFITSDHLAFERHLESWARRNSDLGVGLDQRFEAAALIHDVNASVSIARWAYSYVEGARGQVWIKADQFKHLDNTWREFLAS